MASAKRKITLSPSRDISFDQLIPSQSNVRRVKAGVSIGELADDIPRRNLLQSLVVFSGTGIQDNLVDKARAFGVPVWDFRLK